MKVKILKCTGDFWYMNQIGETFEVKEKIVRNGFFGRNGPFDYFNTLNNDGILLEDCEIVDTEREDVLNKLTEYEYPIDITHIYFDQIVLEKFDEVIKGFGIYVIASNHPPTMRFDYLFTIQEIKERREELRTDLKWSEEKEKLPGRIVDPNQAMIDRDGTEERGYNKPLTREQIQQYEKLTDEWERRNELEKALTRVVYIGSDIE